MRADFKGVESKKEGYFDFLDISQEYNKYLENHKRRVNECFDWLIKYIPDIVPYYIRGWWKNHHHDESKNNSNEYYAYVEYFYGQNNKDKCSEERKAKIKENFNQAWLIHIHKNPHHWQYWVLIDDGGEMKALEMDHRYVFEMICDWWSFSWRSGDLYEIFSWVEKNKHKIILHPKTKEKVIYILAEIRKVLDEHQLKNKGEMPLREYFRSK